MRIEQDIKLDFKDVLIRPKRSTLKSRSEVTLKKTYTFRNCKKTWSGVPIMAANMDTTGTFTVADVLSKNLMMTVIAKHNEPESFDAVTPEMAQYVSFSTGTSDKDFERLQKCVERRPDIPFICIDVANGYSEHFVDFVKKTRQKFPDHILIAGNVVTGEMVEELILSGADIVKVGIGPGSVCTTRKQTGVGYPQLSAVIECADSAHGLGGHIISDGGCTVPGDVAKAFGAGADFVMLGGMLAGHDECAGDIMEEENGEKYKIFYGMSSETAMRKYSGGVAEYRSSEGKTVKIPYRGPIQNTVKSILGGLRSSCTYVGAAQLKELPKRTTFIKVTQQINNIYSANEIKTPLQ